MLLSKLNLYSIFKNLLIHRLIPINSDTSQPSDSWYAAPIITELQFFPLTLFSFPSLEDYIFLEQLNLKWLVREAALNETNMAKTIVVTLTLKYDNSVSA